jgi:polyribonucleotide 5'-hydroxyl-kinase
MNAAKTIDLEARQELIFKVGEEPVKLELRRGLAEVYGTEMLANKTYTFPRNSKAAVFTYHGATVEMTGTPLKSHVSKSCDYMTCYLSIHRDLERMRDEAEKISELSNFSTQANIQMNPSTSDRLPSLDLIGDQPQPSSSEAQVEDVGRVEFKPDLSKTPICFVCEPCDARNVGKSTLCRILLSYAARRGRAPIFVDLDPDQGHIGLPGTIGALSIEAPIDIETGFQLKSSLLMQFGHTSPSADAESKSDLYYKAIVDNLAKVVHSKLEQDKKSYYSGVIINSSSWTDSNDYKILVDACKSFKANMVLVVDDEVLQDDLQKDLSDSPTPVKVINLPKTVEIYKTRATESVEMRYTRIKEYFYGTEAESYNPMTSEFEFSYIKRLIYRIGNPLILPDALMPLGRKPQEKRTKVSHYDCKASDLLHHILAISYCKLDDVLENPDCVLRTNIMGFICITSVRGEKVSILYPQKIPIDHVLLYSDIQYMDSLI